MSARRWIAILWPAFILASLMELLVFAFIDPSDLRWGREGLGYTRQAIYTSSFFAFWVMSAAACALSVALTVEPPEGETPVRRFNARAD
jgi:cobalamin biosynthesis protein CobD/CbiB